MKTKQFILLTAAMAMFLCLTPQESVAQWSTNFGWRNNSPGSSGGDGLLIAAGVAVVGVVVYVVIRNKNKKAQSKALFMGYESRDLLARSFYDELKNTSARSPAELLVGHSNSSNQRGKSIDKGLVVTIGARYKLNGEALNRDFSQTTHFGN